jgi:hypothetical protein
MNFSQSAAAICLAPALRRAVLVAEHDESAPAFEDLEFRERDLWCLLAETVLESVLHMRHPEPDDDSLFQATAEMTRKHFAAIRGGKA